MNVRIGDIGGSFPIERQPKPTDSRNKQVQQRNSEQQPAATSDSDKIERLRRLYQSGKPVDANNLAQRLLDTGLFDEKA